MCADGIIASVAHRPLSDAVGAALFGVSVNADLDDAVIAGIRRIWVDRTIVVFRDQGDILPERQIAFTARFGSVAHHTFSEFTMPGQPLIAVVANVRRGDKPIVGAQKSGREWHSDSQYLECPPSGSFLVAKQLPPDRGDTLFANMFAAYDALPEATKHRIEGMKVVHSRIQTWPIQHPDRPPLTPEAAAKIPDRIHPLVRTHPENGRKSLFLGSLMWEIVGLPSAEGRELLAELLEHATSDRFIYAHEWRPGDAILWDNRSGLHCATPFDESAYTRIMWRTQIEGERPV
jgi:alpha-ketoglutarate-dependent taurine dioxygenase